MGGRGRIESFLFCDGNPAGSRGLERHDRESRRHKILILGRGCEGRCEKPPKAAAAVLRLRSTASVVRKKSVWRRHRRDRSAASCGRGRPAGSPVCGRRHVSRLISRNASAGPSAARTSSIVWSDGAAACLMGAVPKDKLGRTRPQHARKTRTRRRSGGVAPAGTRSSCGQRSKLAKLGRKLA